MHRSRKLLAEYAKIVAVQGADSADASLFRHNQDGNEDFAQLARLTDFLFTRLDTEDICESGPVAVART